MSLPRSRPRVAVVGRPNVGKSSLFNRLARRRVSIVDATPGVTRDRVGLVLQIDAPLEARRGTPPVEVEFIDTGGYGVYSAEGARFNEIGEDLARLTPDIENQIRRARTESDIVLFVIDAQAGITSLDETVSRMLREEGIDGSVIVVANKVDSEAWIAHGLEAAAFGLGEPTLMSATSGYGVRDLIDRLHGALMDLPSTPQPSEDEPEMQLAIVGRRNVGKSTLVNAMAGEERMIVSEIAGTTRDAVDVRFERDGRTLVAIDTAGMRKKKSFADDVEYYAYHRMQQAIERAGVVLFMVDATTEVSSVDKKLAMEIQRLYKPTVIVVNKIDKLDRAKITPEDYLQYLTEQLRGLDYAPIVFMSADTGEGLDDAIDMAFNLFAQASHREPTSSVNRVIETILGNRGPSSRLGTQAKLYYASQVDVHPPTIVLKVNKPDLFDHRYERYLMNRLREELPYSEVPIKVHFSARGRKELGEMKREGRAKDRAAVPGEGSRGAGGHAERQRMRKSSTKTGGKGRGSKR
ncbi:MAG: ribosome biogenesis GTPase Der [Phycisphaerales bacterium]